MNLLYGADSKGRWAVVTGEVLEVGGAFTKEGKSTGYVMLIEKSVHEGREYIKKPKIEFWDKKADVFTGKKDVYVKGDIVEVSFVLSSNDGTNQYEGRVFGKNQGIYIKHARNADGKRVDGKEDVSEEQQATAGPRSNDDIPF